MTTKVISAKDIHDDTEINTVEHKDYSEETSVQSTLNKCEGVIKDKLSTLKEETDYKNHVDDEDSGKIIISLENSKKYKIVYKRQDQTIKSENKC